MSDLFIYLLKKQGFIIFRHFLWFLILESCCFFKKVRFKSELFGVIPVMVIKFTTGFVLIQNKKSHCFPTFISVPFLGILKIN